MTSHWPVVVVGGGPAASAAAIRLGRAGVGALVVEKGDDAGDKIGETLPPEAKPILADLGVAERVEAGGHLPCHGNRSIWGGVDAAEQPFIASPYGPGWHLHRRRFELALIDAARAAGTDRVAGTAVVAADRTAAGWRLALSSGSTVAADFVVDASGRAAWFARRQGARRRRDDRLVGVVRFLATRDDPDPDSYTFVEATAGGWWYSATIPDGRLATAFVTDAALFDRAALTPSGWSELLAAAPHTARRIRRFRYEAAGPPLTADASGSLLEPTAGDGWAAAGDAAAAYDPLASYGITGALAGGAQLGDAVAALLAGDRGPLAAYAAAVTTGFEAYRGMRRRYYAAERRWPDAPFWARRLS